MRQLLEKYEGNDEFRFVVVYQREPHARQLAFADVPQPKDFAERAALATKALDELRLDVDVWIDDDGDQSRALFGDLPHSAIVLDKVGAIRLKLSWCDPDVLALTLPEVPRLVLGKPMAPAENHFAQRVGQADLPPHHRRVMMAHLVGTAAGAREHLDWVVELAQEGPPHQRAWAKTRIDAALADVVSCRFEAADARALRPPPIPPGEAPDRWAGDMARFAAEDRSSPTAPGSVVFVGSSSIRLWETLARDMAPTPVVQRGFGGSRLFDACYWSELLVSRHAPRAVVVFSGTNDIAGDRPKSARRVHELFELFVDRVRHHQPDVPIAFLAITPTLARREHLAIVREANRLIRATCEADDGLTFVDPTADLAGPDGEPDPRFFQDDRLHLNADGYAVWTRHVRPVVERLGAGAAPGGR